MFKLLNETLWRQWAPLPLRLMIGYGFMAHGWAKLSRGPAGFAKLLARIGAPLPEATAMHGPNCWHPDLRRHDWLASRKGTRECRARNRCTWNRRVTRLTIPISSQ